jgi:phosphoglycolate phosphatase (TIGR01487 family)
MMNCKLKAVALDVDGTITDDTRKLCLNAINAIYHAENVGIPVIFVTGNVMCVAKSLSIFLGTTGGLVAENGGVIESEGRTKILGEVKECVKAYNFLKSKFDITRRVLSEERVSEVAIERTLPVELVRESVKDFNVVVYDSKFAIHLTDPLVDKGSSLKMVCSDLGLETDQILAIGDGENDIEFFNVAGVKVAVNNADDKLKDVADYITVKSYGDGVAEAMERFILE